jgi:CxxC motif-containing protein
VQTVKQQLTCIECPQGCLLKWNRQGQELIITGHSCPQGQEYAVKEVLNPRRTLTSTVSTAFADFPRLPVRTAGEIPLKDIFVAMETINSLCIDRRLKPGDIVLPDLINSGVSLIATADMMLC